MLFVCAYFTLSLLIKLQKSGGSCSDNYYQYKMYAYVPLLTQGFQCIGGIPPPNISQNTPPASQKKDKLHACNRRLFFQATALAMTSP